jgi:hypothetical protein
MKKESQGGFAGQGVHLLSTLHLEKAAESAGAFDSIDKPAGVG